MAILDVLRRRATQVRPPEPAPAPGTTVGIAVDDDLSEDMEPTSPGYGASGMAMQIRYRDSRGRGSMRRISVISVGGAESGFLLRAFCHERRAPRSFRSDRIEEAIDLATGEIIEDMTS